MPPRVRILIVCDKPPFPSVDGGTTATASQAAALAAAGSEVRIVATATPRHPGGAAPAPVLQETVAIDTTLRPLPALRNLLGTLPYAAERFASPLFRARLAAALDAFGPDLVQLEGLGSFPLVPFLRPLTAAPIVLRAHNVEHRLWRQRAARARWPGLARWLAAQADRVERLERDTWRAVDGIVAISPEVAAAAAASGRPVLASGVGVEVPEAPPPPGEPGTFFHLGSLDWWPNRDGLASFLREDWPALRAGHPAARLHLAGRGSADFAPARGVPGVVLHGPVDDATAFVDRFETLLVPLRAGSGLRVKIVEAFARARAVVSTAVGAEGIDARPGEELLVVDDRPGAIVDALRRCLDEPGLPRRLGVAAHRRAASTLDSRHLTADLLRFHRRLLAR